MVASAKHKGWLLNRTYGVLAAVNNNAIPGATALTANTALAGVLAGTPVMTANPVDTLMLSNTVANGDIVLATLLGGSNSTEILRIDTSAGLLVINEASVDLDTRIEAADIAYAVYVDAGKNALVLGSNTDTSSADQLITVSRAARTATAATNYFDLALAPAGAVTVPAGTTAVVATVSLAEPNITSTGTTTRAATLYIASQPTEGGTANAAILFGAAANIACTTSLTINDDSEDINVRVETNGMAYALYTDGGKDALVLGSNTDTSSVDQLITISRAARTATANTNYYDLAIVPAGAVTVPTGTTAVVASLAVFEPNITATGTVTDAATVYIAGAPSEGNSGNYALFTGAGNVRFDGAINIDISHGAIDFLIDPNTAAALEFYDGTTKILTFDTRSTVSGVNAITLTPQAITLPNGAGSTLTGVKIAGTTHVLAGQTQITTEMDGVGLHVAAPTINQSGGAVTLDSASTVYIAGPPTAGGSVTITSPFALRVDDGTSAFDAGIFVGATTTTAALFSQATSGGGTTTHYIGNQTVTTSSDSRVKTDIREWAGKAMDLLRKADPLKEFTYNLPGGGPQNSGYGPNARGRYLGWLAQETRAWAPWVVNAGAGGDCPLCTAGEPCEQHTPWTVEYQHLIPLIVKGLQELDQRLTALAPKRGRTATA